MSMSSDHSSNVSFVFFGTDTFSTIVLDELEATGFIPKLIVTAPDRPQGRKLILTPPPAKMWAEKRNIKVLQPEEFDSSIMKQLKALDPELFVVASFGKIIPQEIIDLPTHHSLNVHPSLLPKLRGASPVQTAILEEKETGVTIMRVDEKMDHGPIVAQEKITSWTNETLPNAQDLEKQLAHAGGKLLAKTISPWILGNITEQEQNHEKATYTKKLTKADGLIDFTDAPGENLRKIKAFKQWPKTYFFITHNDTKKRVIITNARFKDGALNILEVLPEGSHAMSFDDFRKGYDITPTMLQNETQ